MLESLDNNILYQIFYFLYNHDIFKINLYNKFFRNMIDNKKFKNTIINRYHPMVFNIIGNYCFQCNIKKKFNFYDTINCNHIIFSKKINKIKL